MKTLLLYIWLTLFFVSGLSEQPQTPFVEQWERDQFGREAVRDQQEDRHRLEEYRHQRQQDQRLRNLEQNLEQELNRR